MELGARLFPALRAAGEGLGAIAFPSECLLCSQALPSPLRGPLCDACVDALPTLGEPLCPRCGLPYSDGVRPGLCGPCREKRRHFRRARALAPYEGNVRRSLYALKYGGRMRVATVLARRLAAHCVSSWKSAEVVVPVPLSRARRRERGFNQAELIARVLAELAGLPLAPRALVKDGRRPPQAGLSRAARLRNAAGAYRARLSSPVVGRDVLLVDDVMTTGATADAAAGALRLAGASAVDVLTIARVA